MHILAIPLKSSRNKNNPGTVSIPAATFTIFLIKGFVEVDESMSGTGNVAWSSLSAGQRAGMGLSITDRALGNNWGK